MKRYIKSSIKPSYLKYAFDEYDNGRRAGRYSDDALEIIADYISTPDDVDVVGICSEWYEYDNFNSLFEDYGYLIDEEDLQDDYTYYDDELEEYVLDEESWEADKDEIIEEALIDEMNRNTSFWKLPNGGYLFIAF